MDEKEKKIKDLELDITRIRKQIEELRKGKLETKKKDYSIDDELKKHKEIMKDLW